MPKEVRDIAEKIRGIGVTLTLASTELDAFIGFALADINKVNNSLWNKINKNKKKSPPPPLSLSSVMRKKRSAVDTMDSLPKKKAFYNSRNLIVFFPMKT
ncbi:10328_t:CDS:2 [Entrophospora sp. SA101]|nr:10328_t:CDS:2 [Entrophospora sp. SA101]